MALQNIRPSKLGKEKGSVGRKRSGSGSGSDKGSANSLKLETLVLQDCANLTLSQPEDFAWIEALLGTGLRCLSLKGSSGVDLDVLREVGRERGWFEPNLVKIGKEERGRQQRGWEHGLVVLELQEDDEEELETRSLGDQEMGGDGEKNAGGEERIEIDPLF
jgi:hypothetical protein